MDKIVNNEIVEQVKKAMPEEESLYDVAELFKVFGDSTRIRIIRYDSVSYFSST